MGRLIELGFGRRPYRKSIYDKIVESDTFQSITGLRKNITSKYEALLAGGFYGIAGILVAGGIKSALSRDPSGAGGYIGGSLLAISAARYVLDRRVNHKAKIKLEKNGISLETIMGSSKTLKRISEEVRKDEIFPLDIFNYFRKRKMARGSLSV